MIGPPLPAQLAEAEPGSAPRPGRRRPRDNVAILALQTRRNDEQADVYQVFGRVHNYRAEPVETEAQLFRHDPDQPGDAGHARSTRSR